MPYLIDGHNLIPKIGLRLDSVDDEMELIVILQEFYRIAHRQLEVYFDGAPAAQAGSRKLGAVNAHFIRLGTSADNAIRSRLKKLGKSAKNWTVVSSDRQEIGRASCRGRGQRSEAGGLGTERARKRARRAGGRAQ